MSGRIDGFQREHETSQRLRVRDYVILKKLVQLVEIAGMHQRVDEYLVEIMLHGNALLIETTNVLDQDGDEAFGRNVLIVDEDGENVSVHVRLIYDHRTSTSEGGALSTGAETGEA